MSNKPDLQDREAILANFLRQHLIDKRVVTMASIPIYWVSRAVDILDTGYIKYSDRLAEEPTSGLLLNMVHRAHEHVMGSLVAFVSGCGASSEVVARAAIELSASILYILSKDRHDRVMAYFTHYVENVEKRVRNWQSLAEKMPTQAREIHLSAIYNRKKANDALRTIVNRLRTDLDPHLVVSNEKWPSDVFNLFKGIGQESTYQTVYARLCSQSHGDAEETLRYFLAISVGDQKLNERMGIETWEFSRLMVFIASSFFISAVGKYAETFEIADLVSSLNLARQELEREMNSIILNVGAF